uniref:Putative trypsin inhibitor like cysteine rich domain protein n=1 Tax=Aedes albopictus TaxID=7160 RepID=A0A023ECL5_AEDAL
MMKRKVVFSVLLLVVLFHVDEAKSAKACCRGRNEQFTLCSSRCEPQCSNPLKESSHCPSGCHVGCTCKRGFVRHPNGSCVKPSQCPSTSTTTESTDRI